MNVIGELVGEVCKTILPIPDTLYHGNVDSTLAVCTLSSMNLLRKLGNSETRNHFFIAGRLLSENKGIDSLLKYLHETPQIKTILVCGKEVSGHRAGHSLLQLHKNGIDKNKKIINSSSPDPYLTISESKIHHFQNHTTLINLINQTSYSVISEKIKTLITA